MYFKPQGNSLNPVQVDHVTFSQTGGAGEVAKLLAASQQDSGIDSRLISLISGDLRSNPLRWPRITVAAAIDEFAVSNHSSPTILSLYRSKVEELKPSVFRNQSIIHLHWLQGVLTHQSVRRLLGSGKKVVWTLHDMSPFTGSCHHAHGCEGFREACSDCPQVRDIFKKSVAISFGRKIFDSQQRNLLLVAPTPWLALQAQKSIIFRNQEIVVIENPIRQDFFDTKRAIKFGDSSGRANLEGNRTLRVTAVASDLCNPAKGISHLVDMVSALRRTTENIHLSLVGRRGDAFHNPVNGISWLGNLSAEELARVAQKTDLLLSGSTAESAGLVVREFGAAGVPTLALNVGGIADLIENNSSGWLASSLPEMSSALVGIAMEPQRISELAKKAAELAQRNRPEFVAQQYVDQYEKLIGLEFI